MYKADNSGGAGGDPSLRFMMQDPYSAMMQQQQQPRDTSSLNNFKTSSYNRASSSLSSAPSSAASAFYHGIQYSNQPFTSSDSFSSLSIPSSTSHDYTPMPAHMNSGLQRSMQSTMSGGHNMASALHVGPPNMTLMDMPSPLPSRSHTDSVSPQHGDNGGMASSSSSSDISNLKDLSDDSNEKPIKDEEDGIPLKKRALNTPEGQKDDTYWDKRKKNNESAKRSREARRMKEEQIAVRVVYLEQENLQLRTEVSLLKTEIEKLRIMLYNS